EIREIWEEVLILFANNEWIADPLTDVDIERLAIEYEMRANPVWTMPGLEECLAAIRQAGLPLGIVSNAQFFTPQLFPALVQQNLRELGFDPELCVWSYEHRQAKPGKCLFNVTVAALAARSITPNETLYIGNDMRNDVAPAAQVGFRTALFAGDARSLRLREDDPLARGITPDAVVTDLRQILAVLRLADS
ncbi:MAG: HAD family hydrolase, partial [Aeoliella sp.]